MNRNNVTVSLKLQSQKVVRPNVLKYMYGCMND